MMEAAEYIGKFIEDIAYTEFERDEMLKSAVLQKLIVMGEAAARVSGGYRDAHTEVEWQDIAAFRNFAVHAYFAVDWRIVWETAAVDAPSVKRKLVKLLEDNPG